MNYPVWYLPSIGGGFLIALIAVTHVFVSHFAVGGGLYLVFSEKKGLRENNPGILAFTKRHAKFFLLLTMVYGSITGVGIWFIVALVNPGGISLLIHNFVFGWATEWVFFLLEIAAAFVYFYTFGKMDDKTHVTIGWIYFISAWISLFLITGIVDVMLTPGAWAVHRNFWAGFFNPSFVPSVFFRTFIATMLAGAYGYLTASFTEDTAVKESMTRFSGKWTLVSLILAIPSGLWYVAVLPAHAHRLVAGQSPTIATALHWGFWAVAGLMAITLIAGIAKPSWNLKPVAMAAFVCAFLIVGSFEWTREASRRPFVINKVMYSNQILKRDVPALREKGFLNSARWVQIRKLTAENRMAAGKELFINQCYACHTIGGFNNSIIARAKSMSYTALAAYIEKIHKMRYFMPPFAGTPDEAKALAAFVAGKLNGKEIKEQRPAPDGTGSGKSLYEENCSGCHELSDLKEKTAGWEQIKIRAALDKLNKLAEGMPPYEGTPAEKDRLSVFLYSLNHGSPAEISVPDGKTVYETHCSPCHEVSGLAEKTADWDRAKIRAALDKLNELEDAMPPMKGTVQEKEALASYLNSLKGGRK
ncbi:MAG: hypothetical protein GXO69_05460 [Acidobacteria bacterium]|nr:hypothetical protein [Acidobacteriota bacterium]